MLEHPPAPQPLRAQKKPAPPPREEVSQSPFMLTVGAVYDGPLDLLLDLIRRQSIDIYDIPIAKLTHQFLAYTETLKQADVDSAGDFVYTAALLIHIKSKMLLPREVSGIEAGEAEDPRRELVERLLEHERFKAAAQMLMQKQQIEDSTWTTPGIREFKEQATADREIAADTTDLVRVFGEILERLRKRPVLDVDEDSVTVGQMIEYTKRRLMLEDRPTSPAPPAAKHALATGVDLHVPGDAGTGAPAGHPAAAVRQVQRYPHQKNRALRRGARAPGTHARRLALTSLRHLAEQIAVYQLCSFVEAAEDHAFDARAGQRLAHSFYRDACGALRREVVDAGGDRRERDGPDIVFTSQFHAAAIAAPQHCVCLGFGVFATTLHAPHRADGVEDPLRRQAEAGCGLGVASRTAAQRLSRGKQFRLASGAVDGTIHASAALQLRVGGIHDGVDVDGRDVASNDLQPGHDCLLNVL